MEVQVEHDLPGLPAVVHHDVVRGVALRRRNCPRDLLRRPHHRGQRLWSGLLDGCHMLLRHHQAVPLVRGSDVQERERLMVLIDLGGRDLPGDDLAEDAVVHGAHLIIDHLGISTNSTPSFSRSRNAIV